MKKKEKLMGEYYNAVKEYTDKIITDIYILTGEVFREGLSDENSIAIKQIVLNAISSALIKN